MNIPSSFFTRSWYRRAQELIPVLENLRGVVDNSEFFQRDNYRVLVQVRRSLVHDMEKLYEVQPSLAQVHAVITHDGKPMDVVIEGALLSLGWCSDLVRPAGLLTGIVESADFRLAVSVLEQAVTQISKACDPDRPLPQTQWGDHGLGARKHLRSETNTDDLHGDS